MVPPPPPSPRTTATVTAVPRAPMLAATRCSVQETGGSGQQDSQPLHRGMDTV
jgi:hypothetical protein